MLNLVWPATSGHLYVFTNARCDALYHFYGIAPLAGTVAEKCADLARFLAGEVYP